MSTDQDARHHGMEDDPPARLPGLIVEGSDGFDQGHPFRFVIPAAGGAAYLTMEEAVDLGRWLISQASARTS